MIVVIFIFSFFTFVLAQSMPSIIVESGQDFSVKLVDPIYTDFASRPKFISVTLFQVNKKGKEILLSEYVTETGFKSYNPTFKRHGELCGIEMSNLTSHDSYTYKATYITTARTQYWTISLTFVDEVATSVAINVTVRFLPGLVSLLCGRNGSLGIPEMSIVWKRESDGITVHSTFLSSYQILHLTHRNYKDDIYSCELDLEAPSYKCFLDTLDPPKDDGNSLQKKERECESKGTSLFNSCVWVLTFVTSLALGVTLF